MSGSLPRLIEFYDQHQDKRDQFEVLAFHDSSAQSFTELDDKLVETRKKYWNGQDLPFPVLLDATGDTVKRFGIEAFPTLLLIDPEGRVMKVDDPIERLNEILSGSAVK